jgi:hypothetical protein
MTGLVPAIHAFLAARKTFAVRKTFVVRKTWMAATSAAMTWRDCRTQ